MTAAAAPARLPDLWSAWRLRWKRRELLWRALRARRDLRKITDRTAAIRSGDSLVFACLRNESLRLSDWLDHYRSLGAAHFLIVDNDSDDGSAELLTAQPDVSLWRTDAGYRQARFGMDWVGWLLARFGHGHWCITVDADELLIYPHWQTRDLAALTTELDRTGAVAMGALMLDLYPKGPVGDPVAKGATTLDHLR